MNLDYKAVKMTHEVSNNKVYDIIMLQDCDGNTAVGIARRFSDHKNTALLLAVGANPTTGPTNLLPAFHRAALDGNVA